MKKLHLIYGLIIGFSVGFAQEPAVLKSPPKNKLFAFYYPSALIAGDIAFGMEHCYKNRFAQELSMNIKTYQSYYSYYDQGFQFNYLVKYNILNERRFRLSTYFGLEYKNVYFINKQIDYFYFQDNDGLPQKLYQSVIEDRHHEQYGFGGGFSINYCVFKKLLLGGDVGLNFVRSTTRYDYKQLIFRDPTTYLIEETPVPSTSVDVNSHFSATPFLRFKIGWLFYAR